MLCAGRCSCPGRRCARCPRPGPSAGRPPCSRRAGSTARQGLAASSGPPPATVTRSLCRALLSNDVVQPRDSSRPWARRTGRRATAAAPAPSSSTAATPSPSTSWTGRGAVPTPAPVSDARARVQVRRVLQGLVRPGRPRVARPHQQHAARTRVRGEVTLGHVSPQVWIVKCYDIIYLHYCRLPSLSRGNIQVYVKPGSHAWDARFQVT